MKFGFLVTNGELESCWPTTRVEWECKLTALGSDKLYRGPSGDWLNWHDGIQRRG